MKKNTLFKVHCVLVTAVLIANSHSVIAQKKEASTPNASSANNNTTPESPVPNAKPGECYAQTYIPPVYAMETQQIVKTPPSKRIEVIPARYEKTFQTVVLKEPSKRLEVIPAVYDTVDEKVIIKPESKKVVEIPAKFETVQEKIVKKPGYSYWKPGRGNFEKQNSVTGDIMCLVEVPPEYETTTRQVMKAPPSVQETIIPAEYSIVKKTVMRIPPTTKEIEVPGLTKTVEIVKEIEPARQNVIDIPAEYSTIQTRKIVSPGRNSWRSVVCDTNATPVKIKEIQNALLNKGFNPGAIDGVLGVDTMNAVNSFERSKNLPVGKYLDSETVSALGVSPR